MSELIGSWEIWMWFCIYNIRSCVFYWLISSNLPMISQHWLYHIIFLLPTELAVGWLRGCCVCVCVGGGGGGGGVLRRYFHSQQNLVWGWWFYCDIFYYRQNLVCGWWYRDIVILLQTKFGVGVIISWHHISTHENIGVGWLYRDNIYFQFPQSLVWEYLYRDISFQTKFSVCVCVWAGGGVGVIISW